MITEPKYPNVCIRLSGQDGNAFVIIGRASAAARKAGVTQEEITAFQEEAMSGNYDKVLQTCMSWFDCE